MNKMITALTLLILVSTSALACSSDEFEGAHVSEIGESIQRLPRSGLVVKKSMRSILKEYYEIDKRCKSDDIAAITFKSKSGEIFFAVYTNEDICDGGNSFGLVLDAKLQDVGSVHDGNISCEN